MHQVTLPAADRTLQTVTFKRSAASLLSVASHQHAGLRSTKAEMSWWFSQPIRLRP